MIYNNKLNSKSILDCTKDNEIHQHNKEFQQIIDFLNEKAKAGAVVSIKYIDPGHWDEKETYSFQSDSYEYIFDTLDCKNGVDFVVEEGELSAAVYGQAYTLHNTNKLCMVEALVTFRFIDEKQKDNIDIFTDCFDFLDETGLQNEFLSIVFKKNDFFMNSEQLINDLKKSLNVSLDEKIKNLRAKYDTTPKKQLTYSVSARSPEEKKAFLDSGLCFIRDWRLGWFEVPASMHEEFKEQFGRAGYENSACKIGVTKDDIRAYNNRWQQEIER